MERSGTATTTSEPGENPLVPNRTLREIYRLMLRLEQLAHAVSGTEALPSGTTAMLAPLGSVAASLRPGDHVSEGGTDIGLGLLRQASPADQTGKRARSTFLRGVVDLPPMAVATERLLMAVGAAVALKAAGRRNVLLAVTDTSEIDLRMWQQMLRFVSRLELPMLFLVLPGSSASGQGRLSAQSSDCGVAGFPVDTTDALALFRVTQESMGRLRSGGGPVLIECLRWRMPGRKRPDPLGDLRNLLLKRGIATEAMLQREEDR